jgi:hypothetical protein
MMLSAKNKMLNVLSKQPDNSSYEDILQEMAYVTMVERGLVGSQPLCTISNQEIQRQIKLMCLTMLLVDPETLEDLEHIQDVKEIMHSFTSGTHGDISFERIR